MLHFHVVRFGDSSTGDQEVAGSTPAESATFFSRRLIMIYFLRSFPFVYKFNIPDTGERERGFIYLGKKETQVQFFKY